MHRDNSSWVTNIAVGQLRHMHQAILLDAYIHEAAEVGDVGDDAGEHHPCFHIIYRADALIEVPHLDSLAWVTAGLLQFAHDIV